MLNYKTTNKEQLLANAKNEGKVHIDFLKAEIQKTETTKNGKVQTISFVTLKRRYFEKFYPNLLPVAKPKEKSLKELIEEL